MQDSNVKRWRKDFPILKTRVYDKPLVYFDNAATAQKPLAVIRAINDFYLIYNSNIHRGLHALSQTATEQYDQARLTIKKFINAQKTSEIIFTRGTTESINLAAAAWGAQNIKAGDEILITLMEHHSNFVPWQQLCRQRGATLKIAPINSAGELDLKTFERLLTPRVKLVAITQVSNSLGTINPVELVIKMAKRNHSLVLIDGAQAIGHLKVDVRKLDCDFYCFSGHKLYGPTGIGVLYAREQLLASMPPYQTGGDMVDSVKLERTVFQSPPQKFEAGTPNIAGAIGLAEAVKYVSRIGLPAIRTYEQKLLKYATQRLAEIPDLQIIGQAVNKAPIISFVMRDIHAHDLSTILDRQGIAIRAGQHCNQPLIDFFQIPATTRISLAFYNTPAEIDKLIRALIKAKRLMDL